MIITKSQKINFTKIKSKKLNANFFFFFSLSENSHKI